MASSGMADVEWRAEAPALGPKIPREKKSTATRPAKAKRQPAMAEILSRSGGRRTQAADSTIATEPKMKSPQCPQVQPSYRNGRFRYTASGTNGVDRNSTVVAWTCDANVRNARGDPN